MARKVPDERKIMREMAEVAFNPEEKTADRLKAMDMLTVLVEKHGRSVDAFSRLDAILSSLSDTEEN
jgi:hypothetical protein